MNDRELFIAALQLNSSEERATYLDAACGTDEERRQRIEKLLQRHEESESFLNPDLVERTAAFELHSAITSIEAIGEQIGPYKLLQQIGEGGMGVVYMAEQMQPVHRKVALKIIKPGLDSRQVIARFEAERQALAMMDHINIARVIDGGTISSPLSPPGRGAGGEGASNEGRPYFVMELINGIPITKYCDDNHLTPRERLELFVPVCQAIQHAHQKGIIHRDIKPSNVLVTLYDGKPVPKVIDFGVAKAIDQKLTDNTLFTNFGTMVGTLEYMSPEQAEMSNLGVDTRSDIYSLGVLLYELLTGSTPLTRKRIKEAANLEILRLIKEEEPQKPSTRLSESGDALASISAQRHMEPSKLTKLVRGELDWIVMKTLEKDRNRRYATANGLAVEVQRYLADEPVHACPPSAGYRVRKFVRRNKVPVIAASLVLLALVGGIIGTTYGLLQANAQRDRAVSAEEETRKKADELNLVSEFQSFMLEQIDPTQAGMLLAADVKAKLEEALTKTNVPKAERDRQVESFNALWNRVNATDAARELIGKVILNPAVVAIDKKFANQPLVAARLRQALVNLYLALRLYNEALPLQERVLAARRRILGEEHEDTIMSIGTLGLLLLSQHKLQDAEPYLREALEKSRRVLGEEHPITLIWINNMGGLLQARSNTGPLLYDQRKLSEAEPFVREALEKHRRVRGEDHENTITSLMNLGTLLKAQGKLNEAEQYTREALEKFRRVLGDKHPKTMGATSHLGEILMAQSKFDEAEPFVREAHDKRRQLLGEENIDTLDSIRIMGSLMNSQGKMEKAEIYYREAVEKRRRLFSAEDKGTLVAINDLGLLLYSRGKLSEAEPYVRESAEKFRRLYGPEDANSISSNSTLGLLLYAQDKLTEAEPYLREASELRRRLIGAEHEKTLLANHNLGALLRDQGKLDEAEPLLRDAMTIGRRVQGEKHPLTLNFTTSYGILLQAQKKYNAVIALLNPIEAVTRKVHIGGNAWRVGRLLLILGQAHTGLRQFAEAEAKLVEALPIFIQTRGKAHKITRECTKALVDLYAAWHTVEPGKGYNAKAVEWKTKLAALSPLATSPNKPEEKKKD